MALLERTNHQLNQADARQFEKHPLVIAAQFHADFLQIHPFADGNGRVARIRTNLALLRTNFPVLNLRSDDRKNYFRALADAQTRADLRPLTDHFVKTLLANLEPLLQEIRHRRT